MGHQNANVNTQYSMSDWSSVCLDVRHFHRTPPLQTFPPPGHSPCFFAYPDISPYVWRCRE